MGAQSLSQASHGGSPAASSGESTLGTSWMEILAPAVLPSGSTALSQSPHTVPATCPRHPLPPGSWQCLPPSLVLTSLRWCSRIFTFFSLASSSPLPGAFSTAAPLCWTRTGGTLRALAEAVPEAG